MIFAPIALSLKPCDTIAALLHHRKQFKLWIHSFISTGNETNKELAKRTKEVEQALAIIRNQAVSVFHGLQTWTM